jgi:Na+/H+ antiporter NhaD/arsenite permease-like protein
MWLTSIWFLLTYVGLAIGNLPGLRMDRAGIALVGATLMMVCGAISFDEAARAVDYATIVLLFGMMVVVAFLRLAGFFERLARFALSRVCTPRGLLAVTIGLSGALSAFLVNDIVCLALTPLVIQLARRLKIHPLPQLIGLATAANIGSVATITGNPQNMIIGSLSHIPYWRFALRLAPVAIAGLAVDFLIIALIFRRRLAADPAAASGSEENHVRERFARDRHARRRVYNWLFGKTVAVTLAAVVLFFTGLPIALVALGAAAVLLLGRVRPEKVFVQVDWTLLVMFTGLFVVVHAFAMNVVSHWGIENWRAIIEHPVDVLSVVSAALSNLVSNVPAVLLFKPIIPAMPLASQESAWLALAMSSTLAGNLTLLGSVANLIVAENARRDGVTITFWEYLRVGLPLTLITLTLGVAWLLWLS